MLVIMSSEDDYSALVPHHVDICPIELGEHFGAHYLIGSTDGVATLGDVDNPVNKIDYGVQIVRDKHHRTTKLLALLVNQLANAHLVVQVKRAKRLICQKQLGFRNNRLGNPDPLHLSP